MKASILDSRGRIGFCFVCIAILNHQSRRRRTRYEPWEILGNNGSDGGNRQGSSPCNNQSFDVDAEISKMLAIYHISNSSKANENVDEYRNCCFDIVLPPPVRFKRRGNQPVQILKNGSN